jgi:prepilin signal peptidase PulO-like enzyme (type II secretory pathway)
VILSRYRRKALKNCAIPFGPFLAAAAVIWTLAGNWIWHWYLMISGK